MQDYPCLPPCNILFRFSPNNLVCLQEAVKVDRNQISFFWKKKIYIEENIEGVEVQKERNQTL